MKNKEPQFTTVTGGKHDKVKELPIVNYDTATLEIEGETIHLESFILSGENKEGKRVLLTWNASLDELCSYNAVLNIVIQDKIKAAVSSQWNKNKLDYEFVFIFL